MRNIMLTAVMLCISSLYGQYNFTPDVTIVMEPAFENSQTEVTVTVSQESGEIDIVEFSIAPQSGSWEFNDILPGAVVGSGTAVFLDGLCDVDFAMGEGGFGPDYTCSSNNDTELEVVIVVTEILESEMYLYVSIITSNNPEYPIGVSPAGIIISNTVDGPVMQIAYLQPDSGDITQGHSSTMVIDGLYIAPEAGELEIISTLVPEVYLEPPADYMVISYIDILVPLSGCTDPEAFNYNPDANIEDGTCQYGMPGDTDQNGSLDVLDIVSVVAFILGSEIPNDYQLWAADINQDGTLNVLDVVALVDAILYPQN